MKNKPAIAVAIERVANVVTNAIIVLAPPNDSDKNFEKLLINTTASN